MLPSILTTALLIITERSHTMFPFIIDVYSNFFRSVIAVININKVFPRFRESPVCNRLSPHERERDVK